MITSLSASASTALTTLLLSAGIAYAMPSMTYEGCFSSSDPLEDQGSYTYQTTGWCQEVCYNASAPVMALYDGSDCFCGDLIPANGTYTSESNCNVPCNGYDQQTCGGGHAYAVYLTGVENTVDYYVASSAVASATSATKTAVTETANGQTTVVVTAAGSQSTSDAANSADSHKSSSPNKAAIAAGVVVGVVGLAALIGGAILYMRARKRRAIEEEYRRNASQQEFKQSPSTPSSTADSRLDPHMMAHRRQSDGSIADNEDFSRRILKVTNPDRS